MAKDEGTGFETHMGGAVADWEGRVALLIEKSAASHIAPLLQGPARGPCWLPRRTYAAVISQFFHGEVAAARLCRRIGEEIDDPLASRFLMLQAAEEDRHAALYAEYLQRLGGTAPVEPAFAECFESCLDARMPAATILAAMTVLLEGASLKLHGTIRACFDCPLLARVIAAIDLDESRHVAFGRIYLLQHVPLLPLEARIAGLRWLEALWERSIVGRVSSRMGPRQVPAALSLSSRDGQCWGCVACCHALQGGHGSAARSWLSS